MIAVPRIPKTAKAVATKQKIYETALKLFSEKGYDETTLRDIASDAGVSLGLTYRYFSRKEEIVLMLYEDMVEQVVATVSELPPGTIADRYAAAIRQNLSRLKAHRNTLGGLFGVGLTADSDLAVFGPKAGGVRTKMWKFYHEVAASATDALKSKATNQLVTMLYAGHLIFVLFWLLDRTPEQASTEALIKLAAKILKMVRPVMGLRMISEPLGELNVILAPLFAPSDMEIEAR